MNKTIAGRTAVSQRGRGRARAQTTDNTKPTVVGESGLSSRTPSSRGSGAGGSGVGRAGVGGSVRGGSSRRGTDSRRGVGRGLCQSSERRGTDMVEKMADAFTSGFGLVCILEKTKTNNLRHQNVCIEAELSNISLEILFPVGVRGGIFNARRFLETVTHKISFLVIFTSCFVLCTQNSTQISPHVLNCTFFVQVLDPRTFLCLKCWWYTFFIYDRIGSLRFS